MFRLLDQLAANNSHGTDRRSQHLTTPKEDVTSSSQMATILSAINKRFDVLESQVQRSKSQGVHSVHMTPIVCDQCEDVHLPDHCPLYMASASVNYMGKFQNPNNNPYSNTYNPGWMNHPNFK